jgi:uncharacterized membrane protein
MQFLCFNFNRPRIDDTARPYCQQIAIMFFIKHNQSKLLIMINKHLIVALAILAIIVIVLVVVILFIVKVIWKQEKKHKEEMEKPIILKEEYNDFFSDQMI